MERPMVLLVVAVAALLQSAAASVTVPAIYVFGDSTVDVGNNNLLPGTASKVNFSPYGIDYPGGKPTGRFTNGYNAVDFFAKRLGFVESPPSYLSITSDAQAQRGVNFASGGSGILDTTGQNESISLNQQIRYFGGVSRKLRSKAGDKAAELFLSRSIFFVSVGSNDLFGSILASGTFNQTEQNQFISLLTDKFKGQLKTLYDLGARKFVVFGSSLLGCVPYVRLFTDKGECMEYLNSLSKDFNRANQIALQELESNLKGFSYSSVNVYDVFSFISSKPQKYGFTETVSACCGSGRFNAEVFCSRATKYCAERKKNFFWDVVHPTQEFYDTVIRAVFRGKRFTTPVAIKELIRL